MEFDVCRVEWFNLELNIFGSLKSIPSMQFDQSQLEVWWSTGDERPVSHLIANSFLYDPPSLCSFNQADTQQGIMGVLYIVIHPREEWKSVWAGNVTCWLHHTQKVSAPYLWACEPFWERSWAIRLEDNDEVRCLKCSYCRVWQCAKGIPAINFDSPSILCI